MLEILRHHLPHLQKRAFGKARAPERIEPKNLTHDPAGHKVQVKGRDMKASSKLKEDKEDPDGHQFPTKRSL